MRNLSTLIRNIRELKGETCIIKNPNFEKLLGLYNGLDYRELIILTRKKNKGSLILYENDNLLLKFNVHDKFQSKLYNKGYIKLLEGNISRHPFNEHLSCGSFLRKGTVYSICDNTILNNPSSVLAHTISIEK